MNGRNTNRLIAFALQKEKWGFQGRAQRPLAGVGDFRMLHLHITHSFSRGLWRVLDCFVRYLNFSYFNLILEPFCGLHWSRIKSHPCCRASILMIIRLLPKEHNKSFHKKAPQDKSIIWLAFATQVRCSRGTIARLKYYRTLPFRNQ